MLLALDVSTHKLPFWADVMFLMFETSSVESVNLGQISLYYNFLSKFPDGDKYNHRHKSPRG